MSPPRLYVGGFLLSVVAQLAVPLDLASRPGMVRMGGVALLGMSALFARWTFGVMRDGGTSASLERATTSLVTSGPFSISRNPIYVAMTGLYLGAGLLVNSSWSVVSLVPLLAIMQWGVILREEAYLTRRFGSEYEAYRSKVRRWL